MYSERACTRELCACAARVCAHQRTYIPTSSLSTSDETFVRVGRYRAHVWPEGSKLLFSFLVDAAVDTKHRLLLQLCYNRLFGIIPIRSVSDEAWHTCPRSRELRKQILWLLLQWMLRKLAVRQSWTKLALAFRVFENTNTRSEGVWH